MPPSENGEQYSTITGLFYVFNLIVGTGALALPGAFARAGWLLGAVLVCILGLVSLITVTYILETLAVVNALSRMKSSSRGKEFEDEDEDTPLVTNSGEENHHFEITKKFEIGEMATILLKKPVKILVFFCLVIYLFGDLSIYCAVVAETLSHVACTYRPANFTCNERIPDTTQCWDGFNFSKKAAYKVFVCVFATLIGPFVFFNLQKTKFLQIATSFMRMLAFVVMISWSIQKLVVYGKQGFPPLVNYYDVPMLFGTCVYSFMCQHSIPGLVQPIANKLDLKKSLMFDYFIISLFYLLLALTAGFTFKNVEDLYTLNFWSDVCSDHVTESIWFLDYYLAFFPVFTLSTSFPIIAITLKNNLKNGFFDENPSHYFYDKVLFPMVAIIIPTILAIAVSDLKMLIAINGYAGAGVQYLIPCILIVAARSHYHLFSSRNPFLSPFNAKSWVVAVYIWMIICLLLISSKYVMDFLS